MSDYMLDKTRLPHGQTERQQKRMERDAGAAASAYWEKREGAILEYNLKIEAGEIRDKTQIERLIEKANGHPDNESVQAARRRLEKKGVDWRGSDCPA